MNIIIINKHFKHFKNKYNYMNIEIDIIYMNIIHAKFSKLQKQIYMNINNVFFNRYTIFKKVASEFWIFGLVRRLL